ncbi:MAG TPA: SRPBCC domain-containing protein [Natronosporangium sp.]|nr:SRPBCC domain-containing protein [Natronosporangium sp.]
MSGGDPTQVYRIYIKATPEAIWRAVTDPDWTEKYGYGGRTYFEPEVRTGATFRSVADEQMQAAGMPEVVLTGEVLAADPPHKLVLDWQAQWEPKEPPTRLTYEIAEGERGVTSLTVTHELAGAPNLAAMVGGGLESQGAGGGWPLVLSDLKTLLETGEPLQA